MSADAPRPHLSLHDHQTAHTVDVTWLAAVAARALPEILAAPGTEVPALPELEEVEINLVDDAVISQVHGDFLNDPTPTDVITFHHGEVFVSTETAAREAAARGLPFPHELALYVVHGLLHLNGHTDLSEPERSAMHAVQDRIWARSLQSAGQE